MIDKTAANQIAEAARAKIAGNPELEKTMRDAWAPVEKHVDECAAKFGDLYLTMNTHRLHTLARLEMLTRFVAGDTPAECAAAAIRALDANMKEHGA